MNEDEYKKFERDAYTSLIGKYSHKEAMTVVEWFRSIRGSDERELIGDEGVDAMLVFVKAYKFNLYDSLMARVWIYAPAILKK